MTIGIGYCIPNRKPGINWSAYWSTLISATVENAAPTHVVLTFATAQPSLGASDFTIAGFTVSSASWADAVLTLVLSVGVSYFEGSLTATFVKTGETATVTNNITANSNTRLWIDYTDLSTITKDGSDLVSAWNDKLASGRNMVQANGSLQPLYTTDGIKFDGKKLSASTWSGSEGQPFTFFTIVRVDAITANCGMMGNDASQLTVYLRTAGLTISVSANTESTRTAVPIAEFIVFKFQLNGANSWYQINDTARVTGNFGTLAPYNTFNIGIGAGAYSKVTFKELIVLHEATSDDNVTIINEYLKKKS